MEQIAGEVVGAVALVLVAMIGVLGELIRRGAKEARDAADTARHTAADAASRIGEPNGHGNVVEMLERILAGQVGQDNRIARLEGGQHEIRQDVARLTGRVDVIERQRGAHP